MKYLLSSAAVLAAAFLGSPAFAQSDNAATVYGEFGCLIAGDAWSPGGGFLVTEESFAVETSSGNSTLHCLFDMPASVVPPRSAAKLESFVCETPLGFTSDTTSVSTPSGKVMLTCSVLP